MRKTVALLRFDTQFRYSVSLLSFATLFRYSVSLLAIARQLPSLPRRLLCPVSQYSCATDLRFYTGVLTSVPAQYLQCVRKTCVPSRVPFRNSVAKLWRMYKTAIKNAASAVFISVRGVLAFGRVRFQIRFTRHVSAAGLACSDGVLFRYYVSQLYCATVFRYSLSILNFATVLRITPPRWAWLPSFRQYPAARLRYSLSQLTCASVLRYWLSQPCCGHRQPCRFGITSPCLPAVMRLPVLRHRSCRCCDPQPACRSRAHGRRSAGHDPQEWHG